MQPADHLVEQIPGAAAVQRRHGYRVTETEGVQLERRLLVSLIVDLVRHHDNRPAGPAKDLGDFLVSCGEAGSRIDDQEHQIGFLHGMPGLLGDLGLQRRGVAGVDAAGVDQDERVAGPTRRPPRCGRG